jgi:hypothetical protein
LKVSRHGILLFVIVIVAAAMWPRRSFPHSAASKVTAVALAGGNGGIGFDDLGLSRTSHQVLVPAGRTERLDLIDPTTLSVNQHWRIFEQENVRPFSQRKRWTTRESRRRSDVGG